MRSLSVPIDTDRLYLRSFPDAIDLDEAVEESHLHNAS